VVSVTKRRALKGGAVMPTAVHLALQIHAERAERLQRQALPRKAHHSLVLPELFHRRVPAPAPITG